ncbi:hypothetical protein BDP81DRAFT_397340 [Colletotrichum phormii]|uniref:Uncharacterized protein n=1 Tax=Colletotrichum phormii TaxID=359342 RepID=A0AAI9ZM38_9PEZI|nr:uncharacterized protein BDP81DRAFT_397340 [Colletotrichum phormii]KAK1633453.1 hypothetical protein BDP81DRAFT_397340 [Colletotrichum phormii]
MPEAGIHPDIITPAISRLLGKDASVRPGYYENGSTKATYYLKAFKSLKPATIEKIEGLLGAIVGNEAASRRSTRSFRYD